MSNNTFNSELPDDGETIQASDFAPLTAPHKQQKKRLRPIHLILFGALSVLTAVVGYLFFAKSVFIVTEPNTPSVAITGGIRFQVGDGYLLLPGTYQVSAAVDGYYPLAEAIDVDTSNNQQFVFNLVKLPGKLLVTVPNVSSGQVLIDGVARGNINQVIENVEPGERRITLETDRYQPFSTTVAIEGLSKQQTLEPELLPAWANISIKTDPEGAVLQVDGKEFGQTPIVAELLQGERELAIRLAGYKQWRDFVDVEPGNNIELDLVRLEKAGGTINVSSTPSGASITVNGNYMGQTPTTLELDPSSGHQITLFKDGFKSVSKVMSLASNQQRSVEIALEAKLGQVRIDTTPKDAELFINGRSVGRADQTLTLPASQTEIVIRRKGYVDYRTIILPQPELEQLIPVTLKTLEDAKWENIATEITAAAGQKLKLFRPNDTFQIGSSRREQGRRANESQIDVTLTRAFYFGMHEVSNRQYRRFIEKHSSSNVKGVSLNGDDVPVVQVSWEDAAKYCNWLSEQEGLPPFYRTEADKNDKEKINVIGFNPQSNGYRLPTEAEWAWIARYENGALKKYGWGEELPPVERSANIADRSAADVARNVWPGYNDGFAASSPIGSFPANSKGIFDMDGNVSEWVNDFYDVNSSLAQEKFIDPLGPTDGSYHVIRGANWSQATMTELRLAYRDYGIDSRQDLGFRIARFVD